MGVHDGHRERMREKFLLHGLEGMGDHEVLELLLFYAIPRRNTNELAHRLVKEFGSLRGVLQADVRELQKIEGIGESAATLLALVGSTLRRARQPENMYPVLGTMSEAGEYFCALLRSERREVIYQVCLDGKGKVLSTRRVGSGTAGSASIDFQEVVANAIRCDASAVMLGHNHPSGVALPSAEDQQITTELRRVLHTMQINLVDHFVVTEDDYVSMAASGMLL